MSDISDKQHEANKQNALLGGVKTDEGKAISRYNAVRHGILRETITEYEKIDHERIFNEFADFYKPENLIEEILVERLTVAYVKLARVSRAENELMKSAMDPTIPFGEGVSYYEKIGYKVVLPSDKVTLLSDVYARYETAVEKRFYRAMNTLNELKKTYA
jgi:hypothetical protein